MVKSGRYIFCQNVKNVYVLELVGTEEEKGWGGGGGERCAF